MTEDTLLTKTDSLSSVTEIRDEIKSLEIEINRILKDFKDRTQIPITVGIEEVKNDTIGSKNQRDQRVILASIITP